MKGVIFTEFLELVEGRFGMSTADRVLTRGCPFHGGYTSVGSYNHQDLLAMVSVLSEETGVASSDLVRAFGKHLFQAFLNNYPHVFNDVHSTEELMRKVEDTIHVEVRKLSPDAELPQFEFSHGTGGEFEVTYRSRRPFALLAEGLLEAAIHHFEEDVVLDRMDLQDADGRAARFIFRPVARAPNAMHAIAASAC